MATKQLKDQVLQLDLPIKGDIPTSLLVDKLIPQDRDKLGRLKTAKNFGRKSYPAMGTPKNTYAITHGATVVKLPAGWEKDWVKEYRALKRYYQEEILKNHNPIFDMIFKKIAYFSIKTDCAMAFMENDVCPNNFVENLQHLSGSFIRAVDQLLRYTMPVPRPMGKLRKPIVDMTDEEIRLEIARVEAIAKD